MSDNEELKPQMLYTVNDAASMLTISRAHLYQLMSRNEIKYLKIGRSTRFTQKQLTDCVAKTNKRADTRHKRYTFIVK